METTLLRKTAEGLQYEYYGEWILWYNESKAVFTIAGSNYKKDENWQIIATNDNAGILFSFVTRYINKHPIFNNNTPNRDDLPRIPVDQVKKDFCEFEENYGKPIVEPVIEPIIEPDPIIEPQKPKRKKRAKKPPKKFYITDGESFELIISKKVKMGKNNRQELSITQKLKASVTGMRIPKCVYDFATFDVDIQKIGDAT